jgi:hypothetical protein
LQAAAYQLAYLPMQKRNQRNSKPYITYFHIPNKSRMASPFHSRRTSTTSGDARRLYLSLLYSLCSTTMHWSPPLQGAHMRCRRLRRLLCGENLLPSRLFQCSTTTTEMRLLQAATTRRAVSPLLRHRTTSLTPARLPSQKTLLVQGVVNSTRQEPRMTTSVTGAQYSVNGAQLGHIEVVRRRVTRNGRVKLKMVLLGTTVDRCAICMTQFKDRESAVLGTRCQHA